MLLPKNFSFDSVDGFLFEFVSASEKQYLGNALQIHYK